MNVQEFRKLIEDADDKVSVIINNENISKCDGLTIEKIGELMVDYLTDE